MGDDGSGRSKRTVPRWGYITQRRSPWTELAQASQYAFLRNEPETSRGFASTHRGPSSSQTPYSRKVKGNTKSSSSYSMGENAQSKLRRSQKYEDITKDMQQLWIGERKPDVKKQTLSKSSVSDESSEMSGLNKGLSLLYLSDENLQRKNRNLPRDSSSGSDSD